MDWTQEELAKHSRVPRGTIQNIEYDKVSPRIDNLLALANALNVPINEMVGEDGFVKNRVAETMALNRPLEALDASGGAELLAKYEGLSPSLRKLACAALYENPAFLRDLPPEAGPLLLKMLESFQKQIRSRSR